LVGDGLGETVVVCTIVVSGVVPVVVLVLVLVGEGLVDSTVVVCTVVVSGALPCTPQAAPGNARATATAVAPTVRFTLAVEPDARAESRELALRRL
jgi:hypothetical protein